MKFHTERLKSVEMAAATIPTTHGRTVPRQGRSRVMKQPLGQAFRALGLFALVSAAIGWQVPTPSFETGSAADLGLCSPDYSVPFALSTTNESYDLWIADESNGAAIPTLHDVQFLPITGVGLRLADALRSDCPATLGQGGVAPRVRLSGRGNLYRVKRTGTSAFVYVAADGWPELLLELPDVDGQPALQDKVAVALQGDAALVTTSLAAGGDVWALDLKDGYCGASLLTADLPPLAVDGRSLRVHRRSAWFVADGVLYRSSDPFLGLLAPVGAPVEGSVLPDLVLSSNGRRLAAMYAQSPLERAIVVHTLTGGHVLVTPQATNFVEPGLDHPRGPFMALNGDGSLIAFLHPESPWHGKWANELYVRRVDVPEPAVHVSQIPEFPVYIDNIGVLGFTHQKVLTFFAGDQTLSGIPASQGMGSADWFAADFSQPVPVYQNLSRSSTQSAPPFDLPGRLDFVLAQVDPLGERILLSGRPGFLGGRLVSFALDDHHYDTTAIELLGDVADEVLVRAGGHQVFVISQPLSTPGDDDPAGSDCDDEDCDDEDCEDPAGSQGPPAPGTPEKVLERLLPLDLALGQLLPVTELDAATSIDRFAGFEQLAAAVLHFAPGLELPVFLDGTTGQMQNAWSIPEVVSPVVHVTPQGNLLFGHGTHIGGALQFVSVARDGSAVALQLPASFGFPLPR